MYSEIYKLVFLNYNTYLNFTVVLRASILPSRKYHNVLKIISSANSYFEKLHVMTYVLKTVVAGNTILRDTESVHITLHGT